jgi:hypothetical protein
MGTRSSTVHMVLIDHDTHSLVIHSWHVGSSWKAETDDQVTLPYTFTAKYWGEGYIIETYSKLGLNIGLHLIVS